MNEEIQKRLIESFDTVAKYIENTKDFVVEQSPIVVQEILDFGLYSNILGLIMCLFFLLFFIILGYKLFKHLRKRLKNTTERGGEYLCLFFLLPISLCFGICCSCFITILKICVAPRLYVLDQIQHIIS